MADLIGCSACGRQLSSEAVACPHCGHPIAKPASPVAPAPPQAASLASPKKQYSIRRVGCVVTVAVVAYVAWKWFPLGGKNFVSRIFRGGEEVIVDEEFGVPSKSWQSRGFSLRGDASVEVDVVCDGDGVNVYVVSEADYKRFESAHGSLFGGEYRHYPAFHMVRINRGRKSSQLGEGRYWVIVENPTWGVVAKPNFSARLKVTVHS